MREPNSWQRLDVGRRAEDLRIATNALLAFEHQVWECQRRHLFVSDALETRSEFVSAWRGMRARVHKSECALDSGVMELENRLAFADTQRQHEDMLKNIAAARDCVLPFPPFQEYLMLVRELKEALSRLTNILTAYVWALEPGTYHFCTANCECKSPNARLVIEPAAARARDVMGDVRTGVFKGLKYLPHNVCSKLYFGFCHDSIRALARDNPCEAYLDDIFVLQTASCFFRPRATSAELVTLHKIKDLITACWAVRKPTFWRKTWLGRGKNTCPLYWSERPGKTELPGSTKYRLQSQLAAGRAVFGYACRRKNQEFKCPSDLLVECRKSKDGPLLTL